MKGPGKFNQQLSKLLQSGGVRLIQRFGECFINFSQAIGPICSCQGELKKKPILQNLFNNLTPQTVLFSGVYIESRPRFITVCQSLRISLKFRIVAERCKNGLKEVKVARPKTDAVVYRYFRPTEIRYEMFFYSRNWI